MKKIKSLMAITMLLIAMCVAPSVYATPVAVGDFVKITDGIGNDATNYGGGSFNVTATSGAILFNTFCLEKNEYIDPTGSTAYSVSNISLDSIKGGIGGGTPDPISSQTAWLYDQWVSGTIAKTDFNATALQIAIWYLEEEITSTTGFGIYTAAADTYINSAIATAQKGNYYGVQVMNINAYDKDTKGYTTPAQSMLVSVPEPLTMFLLGLGLLGIGVVKRKKN